MSIDRARKLIEVALPLEAINVASAHEKSVPRKGHPATMHLWWARRPLAACRAVLFASLVDDPSSRPEDFPTESHQEVERLRLFGILERLIIWENSNDEGVLTLARDEIQRSTKGKPPPVLDPFCGGGSIPLEAQRLGLEAYASDLNPVSVLITKALVEIAPRFGGRPPVNKETRERLDTGSSWHGGQGLASDVRYFGRWVREEAERRIGHTYPRVNGATVIAWLWARTVRCPNPVCGADMPLVRSFALSTKKGRQAWVLPVVDRIERTIRFEIETVGAPPSEGTVNRRGAFCLVCESPVPLEYLRSESRAKRMDARLMAIVAEGDRRRSYLPPDEEHEAVALEVEGGWRPTGEIADNPGHTNVYRYGMTEWGDLFTPRQLAALTTFSDLVVEARELVLKEAVAAGMPDDGVGVAAGGDGASAYADSVATYLSFAVSKLADWSSSICSWIHSIEGVRDTFARQALPMVWDFVEINPLSTSVGNFWNHVLWVADGVAGLRASALVGSARQLDATTALDSVPEPIICTDPPYYDNIGYADLADFFYVWLRRSLGPLYPDLFSTLLTPKSQELVAATYRFGGDRQKANAFFEQGLAAAFRRMKEQGNKDYPLTLFYAFKQAESKASGMDLAEVLASTGWETMLSGLIDSGFTITGTWPMRSERAARSVAIGTNALASSVVLVCRPRASDAGLATRRDFAGALRAELPDALRKLQQGSIAPVDLAQAAIGPGMAVFSRFAKVIEADGSQMPVRTALGLINQVLDEVLSEQEEDYDADTRWAVAWFEQYGTIAGPSGEAILLSQAKNTALNGLKQAGIVSDQGGRVRLVGREELDPAWDPTADDRLTVWEVVQHLVAALETGGEPAAATLLRRVGSLGDIARDLAYRLFVSCERRKWAAEAGPYNALVVAWPEIRRLADVSSSWPEQTTLGG